MDAGSSGNIPGQSMDATFTTMVDPVSLLIYFLFAKLLLRL